MRLSKASNVLPKSLFLHGITLDSSRSSDLPTGGFSDIYLGRYKHRDVALKVLRVFSNMNEHSRTELTQVSDENDTLLICVHDEHVPLLIRKSPTKFYSGAMLQMNIFFLS